MYYFNGVSYRNEAILPRILAEDVAAAELRDPMFSAARKTKGHLFSRMNKKTVSACYTRKQSCCPATC